MRRCLSLFYSDRMSPQEESTCIGDAVKARRAARRELADTLCLLKDTGGRFIALGQRLEAYQAGDGDVTKEVADSRLTFRNKQGAIVGNPIRCPQEQDILDLVNTCDRLAKEIDRLTQIIGE